MNLNVIEWNLNFGSYNKAKPAEFSKDTEHSDVQDLYQYKTGTKEPSELRFYNFHKIRDLLGKKYVLKEIEGEENSWGLMEKNDKIEFGYGCVKNDLIFWSIDIKGEAEEEFFF